MINDRPAHLQNQPDYRTLPEKPFAVSYDALPELVRISLLPLGGIQPVTNAMFEKLYSKVSDAIRFSIDSRSANRILWIAR